MPFITPADLGTHLYPEIIAEITRNDDTIVVAAIDAAIAEVKLYLGRYDAQLLLGNAGTPPTIADALLLRMVKDIATWHLLRLCNTAVEDPRIRRAYDDTIATLRDILNGRITPQGWPYAPNADAQYPNGSNVSWSANDKRNNHY